MTVTVGIFADAESKKSVRFPTVFWLGTVFRVDMNILYILWFFVIFFFFRLGVQRRKESYQRGQVL